jgi:Rrf2 family protein
MLSKRAKYALNALMELARAVDEGPMTAAAIAKRARVPAKFLEAILLDLRKAGMIESRKGRSGGHLLCLPPERINAAEVFRLFDGPIALVPCATHNYYERCEECIDEATCGIRQVFLEVRAATVDRLKDATIADLLAREASLRKRHTRKRKT